MHRLVLAALAAPLVTAGSPAGAKAPPPATESGKPVDCVALSRIRSTQVHGDQVIDFHMRDGTVYRNTLPNACPTLGFEERFSYRTSLSQLCSVDIVRVLQSVGGRLQEGAGCGLGRFQPVTLAKPAKG